jgi:hypothetical protein
MKMMMELNLRVLLKTRKMKQNIKHLKDQVQRNYLINLMVLNIHKIQQSPYLNVSYIIINIV